MVNRSFIEIQTENGFYRGVFTDFTISKSIENLSSSFSFATVPGSTQVENPLVRGQAVRIWIDEQAIVTGWIEEVEKSISPDGRQTIFTCVEKTHDLVTSTLPAKTFIAGSSLQKLIEQNCIDTGFSIVNQNFVQRLGDSTIKVLNKAGNIETINEEEIQREDGESAFDFMVKYANKRQVLLTSDEFGNIVITRAGDENSITNLNLSKAISEKNIKFVRKNESEMNRCNRYEIKSQSFGGISGDGAINSQRGVAFDNEIRATKKCTTISTTSQNTVSARQTALWQSNIQKARGLNYSLATYGFYQDLSKDNLWKLNQIVKVSDDETQTNGTFFVKAIAYNQTLQGSETQITLTDRDAYKVIE